MVNKFYDIPAFLDFGNNGCILKDAAAVSRVFKGEAAVFQSPAKGGGAVETKLKIGYDIFGLKGQGKYRRRKRRGSTAIGELSHICSQFVYNGYVQPGCIRFYPGVEEIVLALIRGGYQLVAVQGVFNVFGGE
jgi:hypothetical protein